MNRENHMHCIHGINPNHCGNCRGKIKMALGELVKYLSLSENPQTDQENIADFVGKTPILSEILTSKR